MPRAVLAAMVALLVAAGCAQADVGKVLIHCAPSPVQQQADPIVDFAQAPSAHLHTSAGADAFGPTMTLPNVINATTSCQEQSDHSELWFPTPLKADGTSASVGHVAYYLINSGYVLSGDVPNGLRLIGGSSSCNTRFCAGIFSCPGYTGHTIPPAGFCNGGGYEETVFGPGQCWTGLDYGLGLGGTDSAAAFTGDNPCAGYVLPRIEFVVDVGSDGVGGYLSSDIPAGTTVSAPGSTAHFDYVYGWLLNTDGIPALGQLIGRCLNVTGFTEGQASCSENGKGSIFTVLPGDYHLQQFVTN